MKKNILAAFLLLSSVSHLQSQSMEKAFCNSTVEEGDYNIILQNRCGNRLTLMTFKDHTQLEFTYKPNATRRKEYWARNFSNRDNQTVLFPEFILPDIFTEDVTFEYDPFVTRINVLSPSGAKNTITLINIADENCFAIAARSPLLLAFKPHSAFEQRDGMLTERFTERGEEIISFIKFPGFEANRFRVLKDGIYILQLLENDLIYIGGEENLYQVNRISKKLDGYLLPELIAENEKKLKPLLGFSNIKVNNEKFQTVLDINKRIYYSALDEGGALNGALARIYYLIWVRDCSMATSLMARGGSTYGIEKLAPFLLNNPSISRRDEGYSVSEYIQIIGSRWSKSEDDGLFYALLALYSYFKTTGKDDLLYNGAFDIVLESIDRFMEKTWDTERKMVGSDTRGETTLRSSPYFGYDVVNGKMYHNKKDVFMDGKDINLVRCYTLYNQVNTYNVLMMANVLLAQNSALDNGRSARYAHYVAELKETLRTRFATPDGNLYTSLDQFANGSEKWTTFGKECDYWEHAWAASLAPYYPVPELQLELAKEVYRDWAKYNSIGWCPWNTLSRILYEYGMSSSDYEKMLTEQIDEALTLTKKYPMKGAVTEYQKQIDGWRALPFQIGALYYSMSGQLIQSMPMGIGVRASNLVDSISDYQFCLSRIDATATGTGDVVQSYRINGEEPKHTLQLPATHLRPGHNRIEVTKGASNSDFRLYSSTAELLKYSETENRVLYEFYNPVESQAVFENFDKAKQLTISNADGKEIPYSTIEMNGKKLIEFPTSGLYRIEVVLR